MSIGKIYIDNLDPLGISDSHVIFTFATKSKMKAAAILYCSLQNSAIIYLSSSAITSLVRVTL